MDAVLLGMRGRFALATLAGWFLALAPPQPAAGEGVESADAYYFLVPLEKLALPEGSLPAATAAEWNPWQRRRARTLCPEVAIDGPAEAYLDLPADWDAGPGRLRSAVLAVRVPAARSEKDQTRKNSKDDPRSVRGRLSLPKADLSGMRQLDFTLPARAARQDGDARRRFHAAEESHYQRLLELGLPGGAWFRYRARQARIAQGGGAGHMGHVSKRAPFAPPLDSLDETFSLLAPERGLSERLPLEAAALPEGRDARAVPLTALRAVTWQVAGPSRSAEPAAADRATPDVDPLASRVPHDQYAIFFPSFAEMLRAMDEWDALGADLLAYFLGNSADRQLGPWYRRQMCIEVTLVDRLLGSKLIASAVLTGSDPYFDVGTDMAVLFEAKDVDGAHQYFRAKQQAAKLAMPGTEEVTGSESGVAYVGVRSADRRVCSYLFTIGNVVGVTNSPVQLRRLVATAQEKNESLGKSREYRLFRERHPRRDETALLVLTEPAIRQWLSPRWRVGSSRRSRAAATLGELQAKHLDELVSGRVNDRTISGGSAGLGQVTVHAGGVRSSVYGTLEFMTPIAELEIDGASQAEAGAYHRWREHFEENGRRYLAPLAIQMVAKPERIVLAASMVPPPSHQALRFLTLLAGSASLPDDFKTPSPLWEERRGEGKQAAKHPSPGLSPKGRGGLETGSTDVLAADLALDTGSEFWRNMGEFADLFLGIKGTHRSIQSPASLRVADNPIWRRFAAAADPFDVLRTEEAPVLAHVAAADHALLERCLRAFHRQEQVLFGQSFKREVRNHAGHEYFRIEGGLLAKTAPAQYETATPDGLFISLNEGFLQRSLSASGVGHVSKRAPLIPPGSLRAEGNDIGRHFRLHAERQGIEIAETLLSTDADRSAQARSWRNLPILEEWKRRYGELDPVALHQRFWYTTLECPGGGKYLSKVPGQFESSALGRPGLPSDDGPRVGPLDLIQAITAGGTFQPDGTSLRVTIHRRAGKEEKKKPGE